MNPYGTDRVRPGRAGQWVITCRTPKGWTARVPRTLTSAQHPGTAVLWDEQYLEVVSAEAGPAGTIRYVLEPWGEANAMRVSDAYDPASELRRQEAHRKVLAAEKGRVAANLLGVLTGHLPSVAQEHLASETGIVAPRLTMLSFVIPLAFEIYVALRLTGRILDASKPGVPGWMLALAAWLIVENLVRLNVVLAQNRPIGSAFGFIVYALFHAAWGKGHHWPSPFTPPKGTGGVITDAPVDVALRDAYTMREPLVTLLTPDEQNAFAIRFGFDYRKHSLAVIAVLLFFSSAGAVTSIMSLNARGANVSAISSLLLAIGIGAEQIYRLFALQRGPVGSFLALAVRPFVARLLAG